MAISQKRKDQIFKGWVHQNFKKFSLDIFCIYMYADQNIQNSELAQFALKSGKRITQTPIPPKVPIFTPSQKTKRRRDPYFS